MQIKRLVNDQGVFTGDKLFDTQELSYAFLEHLIGELVVAAEDGRSIRFKPERLGCYVIGVVLAFLGLVSSP